jgi:hypothetical protein
MMHINYKLLMILCYVFNDKMIVKKKGVRSMTEYEKLPGDAALRASLGKGYSHRIIGLQPCTSPSTSYHPSITPCSALFKETKICAMTQE